MAAGRHIKAAANYAGSATTSVAQTVAPAPAGWSGYWTFATAAILIMLILYLAEKGTLTTWLGFFAYQTPAAIATTGTTATPSPTATAASAAGVTSTAATGAYIGNMLTGVISSIFGTPNSNSTPVTTPQPVAGGTPSGQGGIGGA